LSAGRFHFVATDDLIEDVMPTFDQDIGQHECHHSQGGRFVKNRDIVHGSQSSEDLRAFCFRLKGSSVSLEGAETAVSIHGDDENIAEAGCLGKQAGMARMEQIGASIGYDDPQTFSFKLVDLEIGLVEGRMF
jgi:hypothetical protein